MKAALSAMAMRDVFGAVWGGLRDIAKSPAHSLYISTIVHEEVLRVDEAGIEASAATAVMAPTGVAPSLPGAKPRPAHSLYRRPILPLSRSIVGDEASDTSHARSGCHGVAAGRATLLRRRCGDCPDAKIMF
jgi:Serpin (serine protease inhibitor)